MTKKLIEALTQQLDAETLSALMQVIESMQTSNKKKDSQLAEYEQILSDTESKMQNLILKYRQLNPVELEKKKAEIEQKEASIEKETRSLEKKLKEIQKDSKLTKAYEEYLEYLEHKAMKKIRIAQAKENEIANSEKRLNEREADLNRKEEEMKKSRNNRRIFGNK